MNGVRGGPGEAIEAGSEWGAWRAAGTDRAGQGEAIEAGSAWGARQRGDATEAGRGDRGGPGEAIERAWGTDRGGQ